MKHKVQVVIIEKNAGAPRLLQLRVNHERGGFWQNITGSVEDGESFEAGARRELFEETGLSIGPLYDLDLSYFFEDQYKNQVEEKVFSSNNKSSPY